MLLLCVTTLSACGGGGTSSSSSEGTTDLTTAWEKIDAATASDGVWTLDQTKQAFSLLIAPLPGVTVPMGADSTKAAAAGHDTGALGASLAIRTILAHWDELTAAEQVIVGQALGASSDDVGLSLSRQLKLEISQAALSPEELKALVLAHLNDQIALLETKLGMSLGLTIELRIAQFVDSDVRASTVAITSGEAASGANFVREANPGAAAVCRFTVAPKTVDGDIASLNSTLAHEAFHCFQAKIQGLKLHRDPTKFAMWVQESSANWAADQVVGIADVSIGFWKKWYQQPNVSVFNRKYSAHGLFAEVNYLGNPVWPIMPNILNATSGTQALGYLINPVSTVLKRSWATSLTRDSGRGSEWNLTGTGVPPLAVTSQTPSLADSEIEIIDVKQYAADVYELGAPADILILDINGLVRLGDAAGLDSYGSDVPNATLCTVSKCTCPDGSPLPFKVTKVMPPLKLGFTGWSQGTTGFIEGFTLKRFCTDYSPEKGASKRFCKIVAPIITIAPKIIANEKGHPTEFQSAWTDHVAVVRAANEVAPTAIAKEWARILELYDKYTTPLYAATDWDPAGIIIFDANNPQRFIDGHTLWDNYTPNLNQYLTDLQAGSAYLKSACGLTWAP